MLFFVFSLNMTKEKYFIILTLIVGMVTAQFNNGESFSIIY